MKTPAKQKTPEAKTGDYVVCPCCGRTVQLGDGRNLKGELAMKWHYINWVRCDGSNVSLAVAQKKAAA